MAPGGHQTGNRTEPSALGQGAPWLRVDGPVYRIHREICKRGGKAHDRRRQSWHGRCMGAAAPQAPRPSPSQGPLLPPRGAAAVLRRSAAHPASAQCRLCPRRSGSEATPLPVRSSPPGSAMPRSAGPVARLGHPTKRRGATEVEHEGEDLAPCCKEDLCKGGASPELKSFPTNCVRQESRARCARFACAERGS